MSPAEISNLIVITGPPGSGKTTLLNNLRSRGFACVDEPARQVIASQRRTGGRGTSEQDPALFVQLMLEQALADYEAHRQADGPVFFDRGLPDLIAYADHFGLDTAPYVSAAQDYPYNPTIFFAPAWPDIFVQDAERTLSFDAAADFGDAVARAYRALNYRLADLPLDSAPVRADYVERHITDR